MHGKLFATNLITGATRGKIAATLIEYRNFYHAFPDDPVAKHLWEVANAIRVQLKGRRTLNRSQGWPMCSVGGSS